MSLVEKRSRGAQSSTPTPGEQARDDWADWLEYGASERARRPPRARRDAFEPSASSLPVRRASAFDRRRASPLFVESGVYRVGGDRPIFPRPQPIVRTERSPVPTYDSPAQRSDSFGYARAHSGLFHASYQDGTPTPPPPPERPFVRELPALLPLHALRTVRAEVHAQRSRPPPFRAPPSPRARARPRAYERYGTPAQRPLATSSPPHARRAAGDGARLVRSPLLIAVRAIPSRTHAVEYSPQSQSSSSGFDSKNTSQQNHSSQSGWLSHKELESPAYENWPVRAALSPILDASVDTHYEFDATLSLTETGEPASLGSSCRHADVAASRARKPLSAHTSLPGNIDARVQAMKQEFHEYRKRRARDFLESAC